MIRNIFLCVLLCFFYGCAKKVEKVETIPIPQAKDIKRIALYNQLDNLKAGIWRVEEWKAFAKKICDLSHQQDCSVMGEIYHDNFYGYGSKADRQKSMQILQKSCTLNDSKSCLKLATFSNEVEYRTKENEDFFQKAYTLASKGCAANYAMDCYTLALLYFEGYGKIGRDREKAKNYAYKACEMNLASSCIFVGINADTREESQNVYKKACQLGVKEYCK